MSDTPQISAISDSVVTLLSDVFAHLSVHLKEKKGVDTSAEEMATWLKLPKKPTVITPPYLRGTGPSVSTPAVPSGRRTRGTRERCPFTLTKGNRKGQPCGRPASKSGVDGQMYCGSHIGKIGAATDGATAPVTQHQIPGPHVPAPVAAPVTNGVEAAPASMDPQREVSVDPLKNADDVDIPGKYLEKHTDFVIEANATGGGNVVGKWENNEIRDLRPDERTMALQMGLGVGETTKAVVSAIPAVPELN